MKPIPKKPPKKIVGMEEALKRLPEDQREGARKAIEHAFGAGWDPSAIKPVRPLADGVDTCPECGGKIRFHKDAAALPPRGGSPLAALGPAKMVHFGECRKCEASFMREAKS
jgi:hypothetical protein